MLKSFYDLFHKELLCLYPDKNERSSLFFYLSEEILKLSKTQIRLFLLEKNSPIEEKNFKRLSNALEKLKKGIPIGYILGKVNFLDLDFFVNENVLIPRPETQELVSWILEENAQKANLEVVDLATGSGAIALSLKHYLKKNSKVQAVDISQEALEVAKKNAELHHLDVFFYEEDLLKDDFLSKGVQFDLIVSNPPYVRNSEKKMMHKNVLENEPHIALFVSDKDPLIFYRKIAFWAKKSLKPKGLLYFEINQFLYKELKFMLEEMNYQVELRNDSFSNPRMIKAFLK